MASTRRDRGLCFIACLVAIAALVLAAIMLSMIKAGNTSAPSKPVVLKHEQDIDECLRSNTNNCHEDADCSNTDGSYKCTCQSGFSGDGFVCKECQAVGVANNKTISDDRMNASSFYDSAVFPYYGRLNASRGGGAWCPKTPKGRSDFLEVDMGAVRSVCGVATQGQASKQQDWTKSFKLSLSKNGINWTTYKDNGNETVPGNTDYHGVVYNFLSRHIQARFVRFYPVDYRTRPCLRVEIYVGY